MEKFLIRKKRKLSEVDAGPQKQPRAICSWNADSLRLRVNEGMQERLSKLIEDKQVDLILVQECRMKNDDIAFVVNKMKKSGFRDFRFHWNLHPKNRYSGVCAIARKGYEPVSVRKTFKTQMTPRYSNEVSNPEKEGRVLVIEYKDFSILHTYVPLCGWGEGDDVKNTQKIERRKAWDIRLRYGLEQLQKAVPVIWTGDLNVAHTESDVSHPSFFANAVKPSGLQKKLRVQPGFTKIERDSFSKTLQELDLVDTFRHFRKSEKSFTWSGHPSNERYASKGMRLDYFLCSQVLLNRINDSEILNGATMGSDHRAILLTFKPEDKVKKQKLEA